VSAEVNRVPWPRGCSDKVINGSRWPAIESWWMTAACVRDRVAGPLQACRQSLGCGHPTATPARHYHPNNDDANRRRFFALIDTEGDVGETEGQAGDRLALPRMCDDFG